MSTQTVNNTSKVQTVLVLVAFVVQIFLYHITHFAIILPFILIYGYKYFNTFFQVKLYRSISIILVFLALWNVISFIVGHFISNYPSLIKDLLVSYIYFYMILFFMFGIMISKLKKVNANAIFIIISVLIIIVSFLEYYNKGFAEYLLRFYRIDEDPDYYFNPQRYRLVGPMSNSNSLGLMINFLLIIILFMKIRRVYKIPIIIGFVIIVLFTGSRTGVAMLAYVFFFYSAFKIFNIRDALVITAVVVGLVLIATYYIDIEETVLFRRLLELEGENIFYQRQAFKWSQAIRIISEYPITGVGLLSGSDYSTVDSFYLAIIKTNGVIGLLAFLLILLLLFLFGYENRKSNDALILTAIIGLVLVSSVSADFYFSKRFYPILFILLGFYSQRILVFKEQQIENSDSKEQIIS